MSPHTTLRLGTRNSPMALHQAHTVATLLTTTYPDLTTEIIPIQTSGDAWTGNLAALGGKGAFVREIDQRLLDDRIDIAVHCLKDVPGDIPPPRGTRFAAYLTRQDPRDALVTNTGTPLDELPAHTRLGTSSVRRTAQLRLRHPTLDIVPIRGNVNSRLAALDAGTVDALVLAVCGLHRIDQPHRITEILPTTTMLPPVGAGIVVLQTRTGTTGDTLAAELDDPTTRQWATAERALLHTLQGHCNSPIAAHATTEPHGALSLRATVFSLDGKRWADAQDWADPEESPDAALTLGVSVAATLLKKGAHRIISDSRPLDTDHHH